mmetsp:Transcript_7488/g.19146  ORF Transcript_7488/g.19146 Transcript_7488/m.19146 type:complete len:395 (-) Transcript_7488:233-1417(-)
MVRDSRARGARARHDRLHRTAQHRPRAQREHCILGTCPACAAPKRPSVPCRTLSYTGLAACPLCVRPDAKVSTYAASLHPGPTRRRASVSDDGSVKLAPFVQAMNMCQGAIVIADREAALFHLARNGYEIWLATTAQRADFLFDCYTAVAGEGGARAVGLIDGFAVVDGGLVELKARRESVFPAALAHKAHAFSLQTAHSPTPEEHSALLAAVGDRAVQDALDATVGARFTAPMLGRLLADESIAKVRTLGLWSGGIGDELRRHLRILQMSQLRSLSVWCPAERHPHRKAVEQMVAALPPSLEVLTLHRLGPVVGSAVAKWLQAPAGGQRGNLRSLDLAHNGIGAQDASALAAAVRTSVSVQHLDLTGNELTGESKQKIQEAWAAGGRGDGLLL